MSAPSAKAELVLEAAASVFLRHGYGPTTTDMIQREAGVSKATVYAHYPNKEALFEAVVERGCARLTEELRLRAVEDADLRSTLFALGLAYLDLLLSPAALALYRLVVAEAPRAPRLGRLFWNAGPRVLADVVSAHLRRAVAQGDIDVSAVGVEAAASQFLSLLRAEGQMQALLFPEASASPAQREQWVRQATGTFFAAFGRSAR